MMRLLLAGKSVPANWFSREDALGRQSAKAIFDLASLKMYLSIYQNIFVQIGNCICLIHKMYLFKLVEERMCQRVADNSKKGLSLNLPISKCICLFCNCIFVIFNFWSCKMYLFKLQNVFFSSSIAICYSKLVWERRRVGRWRMSIVKGYLWPYLSENVFVQITKYICPCCKIYLFLLWNIFV